MMKKQGWAVLMLSTALAVTTAGAAGAVSNGKEVNLNQEKEATKIIDADANKMFDDLETMLSGMADSDSVNVIVRLNEKFADHKLNQLQKEVGLFKTKHKFEHAYQGFAGQMTKAQIAKLQKHPMIESIQYDAPVLKTMNTAGDSFGSKKATADFGLNGDRDGNLTSYSKDDVVVAVIDTGIDAAHVDLDGGKVLAFKDFVNNRTAAYDDEGHGSHVAGIIAGSGDGNTSYQGVAPGAALVGIKVLDANGSGTMSNVDAGINWAIANKDVYGIKILNLSLGTSGSSNGQDSTSIAINNAAAAGLVPIIAAGNAGPRKSTIGSPGAAADAITVGAFADVGEKGFNVTSFSSRGPTADGRIKPDIMAPGSNIMSVNANTGNGYISLSGTSMATPYTAGVAALMLDANYALSSAQIKNIFATTAQDFGPAGQDIDYGHGRLQAYEAIKAAGSLTGTGPAVPNRTYFTGSLAAKGATQTFTINVTSTAFPVSTTLIMPNWTGSSTPDFDLTVYRPDGTSAGSSAGTSRQETVSFLPTVTGTYSIRVLSYAGTGNFFLDVSSK